jgi:xanthine dehydrogenase accessory factor
MITRRLATRAAELIDQRRPFAIATVVRARRPTSVKPGDAALVLADGTIEGFVGGVCAVTSVRLHGLRALETGEPLLLRLIPGDDGGSPGDAGGSAGDDGGSAADRSDELDGAVVERNPCLSGGAMEIFLEPHLLAERIVIVGDSPIAGALSVLADAAGYDCVRGEDGAEPDITGAAAVVVASHGRGEERALSDALHAGVPYVALVASPRRGTIVRSELAVPDELRGQLRTPAGLNIGARTPAEIAISILAQFVEAVHAHPDAVRAPAPASAPAPAAAVGLAITHAAPAAPAARAASLPTVAAVVAPVTVGVAVDPVCGMRVAMVAATPQLQIGDERVFFCCDGCRDRYAAEHAAG